MIKKIKGIINAKEEVDSLRSEVDGVKDSFSKEIEELKKAIGSVKEEWIKAHEEIKVNNESVREVHSELVESLKVIQNVKSEFTAEINELKLFRGRLNKILMEDVRREFEGDINEIKGSLKLESDSIKRLRDELVVLGSKVSGAVSHVDKLIDISHNIKKADFDLNKYASRLDESNGEKLSLMRKIEVLERLISKERRSRR